VLCHSDIHPGNLFLDASGTLFIVDWDGPMLAPKERDLMFIGSGQGYVNRTAEEEETLFYRNYGDAAIDSQAMAYYRYERNVTDICVESTRILSETLGDVDRAQSLQILSWLFMPGGSIELAYTSDRTRWNCW
jgi:spectinomycin phosphotransferase